MTESTTDTQLLTDEAVDEIAAMFPHTEYQPTLSPDEVGPCEFCKGTIDDHKANCVVPHVHALCATVKQLRQMLATTIENLQETLAKHDALQSQLEQLRAENEWLKSSLLNADNRTGLVSDFGAVLRTKAVEDAATRMRDKCVEKVRAMGQQWADRVDNSSDSSFKYHYQSRAEAALEILISLQSLTLDPLEPEKQK